VRVDMQTQERENMITDPRTLAEYEALIWSFCRECCGRSKTVYDDCAKRDCHFYVIKNRPRQTVIKFDFSEHIKDAIDIALELSEKYESFTVLNVRTAYRAKYGNGDGLTSHGFWGRLTQMKEWLKNFESAGEMRSLNERSHGDKVKVWKKLALKIGAAA